MKKTTTMEDPFHKAFSPPELKIAAEFLTNWLPFLTKTLCQNCTQTLSNTIYSLDPDFSGEEDAELSKEIHCDCNGDSDSGSDLGSWKDSAMGRSKYVPEALPVSWVLEETAMRGSNYVPETLVTDSSVVGCSDRVRNTVVFGSPNSEYVPETVNVGSPGSIGSWKSDYRPETCNVGSWDSSGSRNRIDSRVECLDHVADTVVFGSWKSDYVPETCNVGSPGSIGSWKSDYVAETRNVGSRDSSGSRNRIDSAVECLDHVADTVVFGSWKSDLVAETHNVGSPGSIGSWKLDYRPETGNVGSRDSSSSRNRIDSAVECLDHVADTVVFGSWKSDYLAETRNVGSLDLSGCRSRTDSVVECSDHVADTVVYGSCFSWKSDSVPVVVGTPDSVGMWKSDYVPENEDRNVGSTASISSWISNYVPGPRVAGSPDSSLGSWKSDYVAEDLNDGSPNLPGSWELDYVPDAVNVASSDSHGNWKGSASECLDDVVPEVLGLDLPNSLGSSNKDSSIGCSDNVPPEGTFVNSPSFLASWADMVYDELEQYDDLREDKENEKIVSGSPIGSIQKRSATLTKVQRECLRFKMVKRKKDFTCLRRVNGKSTNILEGLELHTGVFSAAEQKCIVDFIYMLEEQGRKGELQERTFSAPEKWMQGKGRVTIQFGCCYNYAVLKDGSPPGILRNKQVDPMPQLFKVMIQRLVAWHVLPPTCVPDSCIVNIYDEGDCIPPHIDHHDFLRPFCTVSFLSECNIVFGSTLRIVGPGEFSGDVAIPLPLGSVLILNGNGADVAKHCVPKVPTKRISITFRKMDESKHPDGFVPEPDLQCLEPLPFERDLLHTPSRTQSSVFPSLQKDRQSRRAAPKRVGSSIFLTPQKDRYSFGVSPKSMDSSNIVQPQKDRESSNPVPKSMDTSDFSPQRRNRQSFRFDPNNLESEFPSLQNQTESFRVSTKSVGSSNSLLLQKDRDTFRRAASKSVNSSNFPPFQRNRQSIRIEVDSETGKRFSSIGGSRPEPRHSILGSFVSSSETRYSGKKAWYSGIGTPYAGTPQARHSNTNDRYTGSDPRYTDSDPRYSSWSRPKALGGPPLREFGCLGT